MTYRLIENCIVAKRYLSLGKKFTEGFKTEDQKPWAPARADYSQMSRQITVPAHPVTWSKDS